MFLSKGTFEGFVKNANHWVSMNVCKEGVVRIWEFLGMGSLSSSGSSTDWATFTTVMVQVVGCALLKLVIPRFGTRFLVLSSFQQKVYIVHYTYNYSPIFPRFIPFVPRRALYVPRGNRTRSFAASAPVRLFSRCS